MSSRAASVHDRLEAAGHPGVLHELVMLLLTLAAAMPLLVSLTLPQPAPATLAPFASLLESRLYRQLTGALGLGLIAFQVALSSRRRWRARHRALERRWAGWHRHAAVPLLMVVLAHTGGGAGYNLNRALLACLVGMVLLTQASHVFKAQVWERAQPERDPGRSHLERNQAANADDGWLHQAGLQTHVMLACAVVVLLLAHVVTVYYF
jgi:hypothetical protein